MEWNLVNNIKEIDKQYCAVRVPHDFGRPPRSLEKQMSHFKGIYYNLLLFIIIYYLIIKIIKNTDFLLIFIKFYIYFS